MQILNDPNYYLEDIAETNLTIETDMMVETYA